MALRMACPAGTVVAPIVSELSPKQLQKVIERGVRWGVIKAVLTLQLIALLTILVLTLIGAALVMLGVLTRG